MGQRANLIIVEGKQYSLYYSHWCANTITRDLFWGPGHAIKFVRAQRAVDESGWLDDIWAEGGAVIDCSNQVLMLFGGEDILHDVPLRRVYLEMLRRVWSSWTICWAHEGIADLADYVGFPRTNVLSKSDQSDDSASSLAPPEECGWTDLVGAFVMPDGEMRMYPLAGRVEWYLLSGPTLAKEATRSTGCQSVPLDEWLKDSFPTGGFHIDLSTRTVDYWSAHDLPGIFDRLTSMWSGWNVQWHHDSYESQLKLTKGKLRFAVRSVESLQKQIQESLLHEGGRSMVETVLDFVEKERNEGKDVEVNSWALRDDRLDLDLRERHRIVALSTAIANEPYDPCRLPPIGEVLRPAPNRGID